MKQRYTLDVKLTLIGPILTAGGETAEPGIDAPMARDRHGRWMLPFSLIKGKFLDAVSELRASDFTLHSKLPRYVPINSQKLADWLGVPSKDGSYDPERGRLHFSDFHTTQPGKQDNVIERIQLDQDAGAVKGQMLLMIQAPFGYREDVTFEGTVEFYAEKNEAEVIEKLIGEALRWVPSYGANRTVGFGRTKQVTVNLKQTESRISGTQSTSDMLPFELKLDRPLCLVGRKHSQNHFESEECISGTVLKGAVAQMLQEVTGGVGRDVTTGSDFLKLRQNFTQIRFSEARPRQSTQAGRAVEPPLSIVTCPVKCDGDPAYFDVAQEEQACLIHGASPAFMPDWKGEDFASVRGAFGWSLLPRERRTRTAINPNTGRAADEQLFSYGLVLPYRTVNGTKEEFVWDGCIGLECLNEHDRKQVCDELAKLLQNGIVGVGKTRAVASVNWAREAPAPTINSIAWDAKQVIIMLQTECLMTNPETLKNADIDPVEEAYREFWADISNGALSLKRFFARQSLHGGFVSLRARQSKSDNYEPFLLTDRGSVFVLDVKDDNNAKGLVDQWQQHGLPNAAWLTDRYAKEGAPLWQRCPYIRENGYGEIAVNLKFHFDNRFPAETTAPGAKP
jgi:hypothetical protein